MFTQNFRDILNFATRYYLDIHKTYSLEDLKKRIFLVFSLYDQLHQGEV